MRDLVILRAKISELTELALSRFVKKAGRAVGLKGEIDVLVTSSGELRKLNRRFRKKDKATDVLSFPPMFNEGFSGDIAVSAEIATRNAKQLGHAPADEVRILILHGMLHLAGYDHETDHGEMARRERSLRKRLTLPVGLIERNVKAAKGKRGLTR